MKEIKDIQTALNIFQEAANKQAAATEEGNYKTGNRCYDQITEIIAFLKEENAISELEPLLYNWSAGVRLWAAYYLLPVYEKESLSVLGNIAKDSGIHSLTAETTIREWKNGSLKF